MVHPLKNIIVSLKESTLKRLQKSYVEYQESFQAPDPEAARVLLMIEEEIQRPGKMINEQCLRRGCCQ
jgi:hypothetical protein